MRDKIRDRYIKEIKRNLGFFVPKKNLGFNFVSKVDKLCPFTTIINRRCII